MGRVKELLEDHYSTQDYYNARESMVDMCQLQKKQLRLTNEQIAEKAEVSAKTVQKFLNGGNVGLFSAMCIANALDLEIYIA